MPPRKKLREAAAALYAVPPSEDIAQELYGVSPDQLIKTVEVWPDVWPVVSIFTKMAGQWRVGPCGAYALDYGVLQWMFNIHGITNQRQALDDIRVLEEVAKEEMKKAG